jgi:hypothetical protein
MGGEMRLSAFVMAFAVAAAPAPAHAAWKQFKSVELGFAVDFPAEIKTSKGEWKGAVARTAPTTVISAELDNVTYQAIVADFSARVADTPTILGEAAYILSLEGMLVAETMARSEPGPNAIYGRRITTMLPDGAKKTTEVYAKAGKLYLFVTTISAKGDLGSATAARFQDSILFDLERDRTQ